MRYFNLLFIKFNAMITYLIINSFFIFGIYTLCDTGQLLGFIGKYVRKMPKYFSKPLTECPPCMASFWGTLGFAFSGLPVESYFIYIIALSGLNYIIGNIT